MAKEEPEWQWSIAPACPNCGVDLSSRGVPKRNSKFTCKDCGDSVFVRPRTYVFETPYLGQSDSGYEDCLAQMEQMAYIWCNKLFYKEVQRDLSKQFGSAAKMKDVIWQILLRSKLHHCTDWHEHLDIRGFQRAFLRLELIGEWETPRWNYYERHLSVRAFAEPESVNDNKDDFLDSIVYKKDLAGEERDFWSIWPRDANGKNVIYLDPITKDLVKREMTVQPKIEETMKRLKDQFPTESEEWYVLAARELVAED